jgi:glycosyltransferase involved in cell wall biosynthesis
VYGQRRKRANGMRTGRERFDGASVCASLWDEPMRICVDASPLLLRSVGVKTYFYHWLEHLVSAASPDEIQIFPWLGKIEPLHHQRSQIGLIGTCLRRGLLAAANRKVPLALGVLTPNADLFHVSSLLRRPPEQLPLTATVYDMTTRLFPQLHTESNIRHDKYFGESVLKRAKGLIAISNHTRDDAIRLLGLNPDVIEVIYPGVSEEYFTARANQKRRFARPYLLSVGTIEPRKNVATLLDAYGQLERSVREAVDLVVVGPPGWKSQNTMARLCAPPPGVHYLGYVAEAEMPGMVADALAMVYPSLYEGFGLPVAEAMACAVPVITSAVSSLPEVAGDAGLLVDPQSVGELTAAIERIVKHPDLRKQLGANGAARARAEFRWASNAERSMSFFRRTAARYS